MSTRNKRQNYFYNIRTLSEQESNGDSGLFLSLCNSKLFTTSLIQQLHLFMHVLQVELDEFGDIGFCRGRKTGEPRENQPAR